MLDFLIIKQSNGKDGVSVYPDFRVGKSKDLMIRGGAFYAMWDPDKNLWTTDEYDAQSLVDKYLREYTERLKDKEAVAVTTKYMSDFSNGSWTRFKNFLSKLSDQSEQLDNTITFSNSEVSKTDYVSKKLNYPLEAGDTPAFDKLFKTLYDEEELTKIMWAIGSIISGDSKNLQKFFVLFGAPGTGKSTVLNLIQNMFDNYYTTFEAKTLTSGSSGFSTEVFRKNPLIGINHEGDLSNTRDNSILNSVVAHDQITMNVKYQHSYTMRINTLLFIATNKPVHITDAHSGLIRRLIDIRPSGYRVSPEEYDDLMSQIQFEYGAIAVKCLALYKSLGFNYYSRYRPVDMMFRTNVFFNFVDEYYLEFNEASFVTLKKAWDYYKAYCEEANITYRLKLHNFRDEFRPYWKKFEKQRRVGGQKLRSVYSGFKSEMFNNPSPVNTTPEDETPNWLSLKEQESILDDKISDRPAQYASDKGTPKSSWGRVKTTTADIDTTELHYILPPENMITIDFDLKDSDGNKSLELNLEAARKFPPTYAEVSKGGSGLHLHYWYDGDTTKLSRVYDEHVEVLVPVGKFSIRRRLSTCNNLPIATINSGLPLKGDTVVSEGVVKSERSIRLLIKRNLNKEIHPATKPSVDFIDKILQDAYDNNVEYDVTDLKPYIIQFASSSTNQADNCLKIALKMKFKSEVEHERPQHIVEDTRLTFFDVEVFPNLLLICWKYEGEDQSVNRMFNPSTDEMEQFLKHNLVGFNNRRYDNHILYARYLGYSNEQIYTLSSRIVGGDRSAMMREAYNISHTDVYDYSSKKQSLKKWQIELGIFHKEMHLAWDKPVDESQWEEIAEYCDNDVISLEATHNHCIADYQARLILTELSGMTPNHSTQSHTAKIIFGNDRNPQRSFNYVDLSKQFPGYEFNHGVSTYRDEIVGEGGYVFSKPGMYEDVIYMDITSMHPRSIEVMNMFGQYTSRYSDIKAARIAIKNGNTETVGRMFNGALVKYLGDKSMMKDLSYALKIVINIVYGLTSASFDNPFRDPRNIDNIVAKRGALFMVDLKHALMDRGTNVIHIKTDSVKIADYTQDDIDFVKEFGKKYGYNFEIEDIFSKLTLINDAVLIAKNQKDHWEAVGARFAKPYTYKKLFSKEPILFEDMCESRSIKKGVMYLQDGDDEESRKFVGKVGQFCPMKPGTGGATLVRVFEDKTHAVAGTKGFEWMQAETVLELGLQDSIDTSYFNKEVDAAIDKIGEFGDVTGFLD